MTPWRYVAALLLAAPTGSLAQEGMPPPAPEDLAIYALAVDSTDYPDESVATLLDSGYVRAERDGTVTRVFRVVRQALTKQAADALAELSFNYDPGREEFSLDWARVVDRDGTVVGDEPIHVQEADVPAARGAPVYTERKVVRASLPGMEPGLIVDWRYTLRVTNPAFPGDFWRRWPVNGSEPVRLSSFVLDVPASLEPRLGERNLPSPARVVREDGRVVRAWEYEEVEQVESEPFAADSNAVRQEVVVSAPFDWDDVAAWYAGLAEGRYVVTPDLEARLAEVTREAAGLEESLRALHRWVSQDIRYVSISLGLGGYQPRPPAEVVDGGAGDCKDKTTLFVALARRLGAEAFPVIVATRGHVLLEHPTIAQFDHMVAAVRVPDGGGGEWVYVDLTVPIVPWGEVHAGLQGEVGVMLRDDGTAEAVEFPAGPAQANRSSIVVHGTLSAEGDFVGEYTEVVTGAIQYRIRGEFARRLTDRALTSLSRNLARRVFDEAEADSVETFDGLDLTVTPRLWASVRASGVLDEVPGGWMLPLRIPSYGNPDVIARLEEDEERSFPIDAERVFGAREHYTEYRITLPAGWKADLPESVRAESVFGVYESTYEQEGDELLVRRVMRGTRGVHPPDRVGELVAWLKALSEDRVRYVTLTAPAAGGASSSLAASPGAYSSVVR